VAKAADSRTKCSARRGAMPHLTANRFDRIFGRYVCRDHGPSDRVGEPTLLTMFASSPEAVTNVAPGPHRDRLNPVTGPANPWEGPQNVPSTGNVNGKNVVPCFRPRARVNRIHMTRMCGSAQSELGAKGKIEAWESVQRG